MATYDINDGCLDYIFVRNIIAICNMIIEYINKITQLWMHCCYNDMSVQIRNGMQRLILQYPYTIKRDVIYIDEGLCLFLIYYTAILRVELFLNLTISPSNTGVVIGYDFIRLRYIPIQWRVPVPDKSVWMIPNWGIFVAYVYLANREGASRRDVLS